MWVLSRHLQKEKEKKEEKEKKNHTRLQFLYSERYVFVFKEKVFK